MVVGQTFRPENVSKGPPCLHRKLVAQNDGHYLLDMFLVFVFNLEIHVGRWRFLQFVHNAQMLTINKQY